MNRNSLRIPVLLLAGACMITAQNAFAEQSAAGPSTEKVYAGEVKTEIQRLGEVVIDRGLDTLPDDIRPPIDPDTADTVLVFTNLGSTYAAVKCVAFNRNGRPIGRTATRVPALGVRYVTASDISDGLDFIGHVQCARSGRIVGSAVFVGPGFTDLPVIHPSSSQDAGRIRFPLVVHY